VIAPFDASVAGLLDHAWPGMSRRIAQATARGFRWQDISTAFVAFAGNAPIAHVGVIEIPLVIDGCHKSAAGIHAVCTHPDHRGRGHCRALLEEALAHCDAHHDIALLYTGHVGLYEKFGFWRTREHCFRAAVHPRTSPADRAAVALPEGDPATLEVVRRLLACRTPISEQLGVVEASILWGINAVLQSGGEIRRLHYLPDLDVITVHEIDGWTLRLYDVIGRRIPPLAELLERIATPVDTVIAFFTPDRLEAPFTPEPIPAPYGDLMIRGTLGARTPFMFPALARC
jgi:predicted N-acetyltransferase YhbS